MLRTIDDVIQVLRETKRVGSLIDLPEGTRYIQISETLLDEMIEALEGGNHGQNGGKGS